MSVAESLTLLEDILEECEDDHVGLWSVIREVRKTLPHDSTVEIKQTTLDLIRFLLARQLIEAGFPTADGRGFDAWNFSTDEAVNKISQDWDSLGREPTGGDVVWFTSRAKP